MPYDCDENDYIIVRPDIVDGEECNAVHRFGPAGLEEEDSQSLRAYYEWSNGKL